MAAKKKAKKRAIKKKALAAPKFHKKKIVKKKAVKKVKRVRKKRRLKHIFKRKKPKVVKNRRLPNIEPIDDLIEDSTPLISVDESNRITVHPVRVKISPDLKKIMKQVNEKKVKYRE